MGYEMTQSEYDDRVQRQYLSHAGHPLTVDVYENFYTIYWPSATTATTVAEICRQVSDRSDAAVVYYWAQGVNLETSFGEIDAHLRDAGGERFAEDCGFLRVDLRDSVVAWQTLPLPSAIWTTLPPPMEQRRQVFAFSSGVFVPDSVRSLVQATATPGLGEDSGVVEELLYFLGEEFSGSGSAWREG